MTAPPSPAPAGLARIDAFLVAPQATDGERALTYLAAVAGAVLVLVAPSELRRPVGFAATALGITMLTALAEIPTALAWFAPVILVKLLLAHLLPWR